VNGGAITIVIFASAFLAILCAGAAISGGAGRARSKRAAAIRTRAIALSGQSGEVEARSLARGADGISSLELRLASLIPRRAALRRRLQRAGLAVTIGRYAVIGVATTAFSLLAFKVVFGLSWVLAILVAIIIGIMGPHLIVSMLIGRRTARFNQQFPEAIDLMVRGLKSGLPISETIINVGEEMADPVGTEFGIIADEVRLGATLDEALWDAARRLEVPEFKFFTISLSVQRETGGNLGETLGNLGEILRKRLSMRLKVKAMSSEARASAYIIGSLPFIMFLILYLMNGEYVMRLFTDPRGLMMTGVGLFMMLVGAAVMYKMVRFEV